MTSMIVLVMLVVVASGSFFAVDSTDVRYFDCTTEPIDLVLLLDSSASLGNKGWNQVKTFAKKYLDHYDISTSRTHVAIVQYATRTKVVNHFNAGHDVKTLKAGIDSMIKNTKDNVGIGIATHMDTAFRTTLNQVFTASGGMRTKDITKVLVFITDGKNNGGGDPVPEAQKLKDKGVLLISLGVGNFVDKIQLKAIASKDMTFLAKDFNKLIALIQEIVKKQCEVICISKPVDLALLLDSSSSIDEATEWVKVKKFAKSYLDHFEISNTGTHVAIVQYATRSNVIGNFNAGHDVQTLKAAIDSMIKGRTDQDGIGVNTHMAKALKKTSDQVFTASNGMRKNQIKKVLVFFTDGRNNGGGDPVTEAQKLKNKGVLVMTLGVGRAINRAQLEQIATAPTYFFLANDFNKLTAIAKQMVDKQCTK